MKKRIIYIAVLSVLLAACGGGDSSSSPIPQNKTFNVSASIASGEGAVTPPQQSIEQGKTTTLNLIPKEGYKIASATGCNGTLKGNVYTTGAINADCQVQVGFEPLLDLNVPSELTMNSTINPSLKDLTTDWNSKVTEIGGTQLSFAGNPKLVSGDVFVVKDTAYKVVSVTGDTVGNTIVTVTQPELNEIYEKIEISGKMDALEFIPNPELFDAAPQARAVKDEEIKHKIKVNAKEDGFMTFQYEMSKKLAPNLKGEGNIKIGAKGDFSKEYEVITNKGQAELDVYINPNLLLSLEKTLETDKDYSKGICSSNSAIRQGGRIYLGSIPLGKAAAALPGGQIITATTNIEVPVCLVANVTTDMKYDIFNLSGKFQTKIVLGNQSSPQVSNQNSLTVEMPPSRATLSDATFVGTSKKMYSVTAKGEAGIEAGVEIEDKLGKIVNVGVNVAVLARPELTGTFGVGLLGKNFSSLAVEPEACLELKVKGDFESKAFSKTFWNKEPLIAVGTFPLIASETKKWGMCKDDSSTGSESDNDKKCMDSLNPIVMEYSQEDRRLLDIKVHFPERDLLRTKNFIKYQNQLIELYSSSVCQNTSYVKSIDAWIVSAKNYLNKSYEYCKYEGYSCS